MFSIPPRDNFIWYGIDLDGTVAAPVWQSDYPKSWFAVGRPIDENVKKLLAVKAAGYKIMIHTARPWDHYELVEQWLIHHDIPFDGIIMGKFNCFIFVDDKAINASESSWLP